jgi:hypothetical protein
VALAVEPQLADAQRRGRRAVPDAPQQRAQPRPQLADGEGLGQVVVGSGLEAVDAVLDAGARADHEDRHPVAGAPQPPAEREPVHVGQAEVEHDRVGRRRRELAQAVLRVLGQRDVEAAGREREAQHVAHRAIVLDDQDARVAGGAVVVHGNGHSVGGTRESGLGRP